MSVQGSISGWHSNQMNHKFKTPALHNSTGVFNNNIYFIYFLEFLTLQQLLR